MINAGNKWLVGLCTKNNNIRGRTPIRLLNGSYLSCNHIRTLRDYTMELIKTSALASLALKYLALATLLLGATAHTAAQPLVDENGHQLYTIYLDEHLVEQVDASDQEPM